MRVLLLSRTTDFFNKFTFLKILEIFDLAFGFGFVQISLDLSGVLALREIVDIFLRK
jgi:hypothetical protein